MLAGLALVALPANPVQAAGEILITHTKALAGGVTPGDAPGYPVTLTLPGAYELADNLIVGPGRHGIYVASPDVTIDLKGFRISGGPAGGGSATNAVLGIYTESDRLTVQNGTIGGFVSAGIQASTCSFLIVRNMRIVNGAGYGIRASGANVARITGNTIATNRNFGVTCGFNCQIESNNISANQSGISIASGIVLGNIIAGNAVFGIAVSSAARVGIGNNVIANNNRNLDDNFRFLKLQPNACFPDAC
jgi:hypothetical protein